MTRFYFIRHGESKTNLLKCFTGQLDSKLTETGRKQAILTANFLKNVKFDVAYSSDLDRAYETCKIIIGGRTQIISDKNLREINGGLWEGLSFDEIEQKYPNDSYVWHNNLGFACPTAGESVAELYNRITSEILNIAVKHDGQTVLVATHAMPIRCLMCKAQGVSVNEIGRIKWVPNSSISIIDVDGSAFRLIQDGYADHISEFVTCLPDNI